MKISKIRAIVIRENFSGESDKFIILFAKDIGKVSVFAKGARNTKSKFLAGTALFTYGDFVIQEQANGYRLNSVDIIENFYSLRNDIFSLAYGTYFLELCDKCIPLGISENNLLLLLLKSLQRLLKNQNNRLVSAVFMLKLIDFLGYYPHISYCIFCGSNDFKYISNEGLLCEKCLRADIPYTRVSPPSIQAMEYIRESSLENVFNFNLSVNYITELENVGTMLIAQNIGKEFKSFEFLKNLY